MAPGVTAYDFKIGYARFAQHLIRRCKNCRWRLRLSRLNIVHAASAMICGLRLALRMASGKLTAIAAVAMVVRGHKRIDGDALPAKFLGHAQRAQAHAVFADAVRHVILEPARLQAQRRRQRQDMRIAALPAADFDKPGQARLRAGEGAARIHALHQVVTLHRRRCCGRQQDRAGVVDKNIYAAEYPSAASRHRRSNGIFVAHIELQRQRAAASGFDLRGDTVNGAGQRLACASAVFAVTTTLAPSLRAAQRDFAADAAAGAGNEYGFMFERHGFAGVDDREACNGRSRSRERQRETQGWGLNGTPQRARPPDPATESAPCNAIPSCEFRLALVHERADAFGKIRQRRAAREGLCLRLEVITVSNCFNSLIYQSLGFSQSRSPGPAARRCASVSVVHFRVPLQAPRD